MRIEYDYNYYLGSIFQSYLGYSYNQKIRKNAASGGITTEILRYSLLNNYVDAVVVSKCQIHEGIISTKTSIIQNPEELCEYSGSLYMPVPVRDILSCIHGFDGKVAIVGLPCHLRSIERIINKDPHSYAKLVLKIGLFCGHNSKKELIESVLKKKKIERKNIRELSFRRGHWRGKMVIGLSGGKEISFPFSVFSIYQNLHFLSEKKCMFCFDHTCENSDISCGDAWLPYLKSNPIKHSVIISRNSYSNLLLEEMRKKGLISLMKIEPEIVFKTQKRAIIFHKAVSARKKIFGNSTDGDSISFSYPPRWNEKLASCIIRLNFFISENSRLKKILFSLPKEVLYPYLIFFKILTNF